MELEYRNVNHALSHVPYMIHGNGVKQDSRNGPVISLVEPLTLVTQQPTERVLLCPIRRANPFLFLLDGLSILSSVNFVRPLADIVPRFREYSDDGVVLRAHYGKRLFWQINPVIDHLMKTPGSRRAVMSIWDPREDLGADSKDLPCNVTVNLRIVGGALDLVVFNRSNDVFWGLLGANIVQFSFLQEYIARCVGVKVGRLYQITTNAHIYTEFGPGKGGTIDFSLPAVEYPPVVPLDVEFLPSALNIVFLALNDGVVPPTSRNPFIHNVVLPMLRVWHNKDLSELRGYPDCDWFHAARMFWETRA
jgi:hypothetical protein